MKLNRAPETLALKMPAADWGNIARCASERARAADNQRAMGEYLSARIAWDQGALTRRPFPLIVGDVIRFCGPSPEYDRLEIDRDKHIESALGTDTLSLPDWLDEILCDCAKGWQDSLCEYLAMVDDRRTEHHWQHFTIGSGETDLSGEIDLTVFFPASKGDPYHSRDSFAVVGGKVYPVDCIAETSILDDTIGWYVDSLEGCEQIDGWDSLSAGYSSNPTSELERSLWPGSEPVWHHGLNCFVGRLKGENKPVRLYPQEPSYA